MSQALSSPRAQAPVAQLDGPVTPALEREFRRALQTFNEQLAQQNAARQAAAAQNPQAARFPPQPLYTGEEIDELCRLFREGGELPIADCWTKWTRGQGPAGGDPLRLLRPVIEHPDLALVPFVRLLILVGYVAIRQDRRCPSFMFFSELAIDSYRAAHAPKMALHDLAAALPACGLAGDMIALDMLASPQLFDWERDAVEPYFTAHLDLLEKNIDPPADRNERWRWNYGTSPAVTRILSKFAAVPPPLVEKLWAQAIGTNRTDRLRAQQAIATLPELQARLGEALKSGSFQTRMVAAEWLGRLGDRRAVAPLEAAARKEKQDAALDEILTALERLGQPIDPYLDREKLESDAAKGLKKGIPPALAWFPFESLPEVHWQDNGQRIPADVVRWLLVQNFKLKSAEPGPLLRRYCALVDPQGREALGDFVLSAWLAQDLKCRHTDAEARSLARQRAPQTFQAYQQALQWFQQQKQAPPALYQATLPEVEQQLYEQLLRDCGSAVAEKGLLALAGACCGDAAVAPVQKYLKEWYGYRAAQCKALIAMLSGIDRPAAIQYLLSIANRFRTKGIREEAEKYVQILAERRGWTLDELADRTLPTAGFDDEGQLELSYGPRQFVARVNAGLEIVLSDGEGKALKSLPEPRKDDDADQAKGAKKALSAAKSELKKFVAAQGTRLYEAMCTQRAWPLADWKRYLMGHPLMKSLCQRVVWMVNAGKNAETAAAASFRPLDDGTLTDFDDRPVSLSEDATVQIAHSSLVSVKVAEAWAKHLTDYDVSTLFPQFGRTAYMLPDEKRRATSIDDFRGHIVEAFKLRGLAAKFGYTRGQAQDGGWFYDYVKLYPGLGLQVRLNFSGNGLPEENRQVSLTEIAFQRPKPQGAPFLEQAAGVPLGEIPAVLLAECYSDLKAIASTGPGFDPDWERKVG